MFLHAQVPDEEFGQKTRIFNRFCLQTLKKGWSGRIRQIAYPIPI
jgi:hypothetical protein